MEAVEQWRGPHLPGAADEALVKGNSFQRTWSPKGDPHAPAVKAGWGKSTTFVRLANSLLMQGSISTTTKLRKGGAARSGRA